MTPVKKTRMIVDDTDLFEAYSPGFPGEARGSVQVREEFGTGAIRIHPVRKGISYSVNDMTYSRDLSIRTTKETLGEHICFYAYLSGSAHFTFEKRSFGMRAGGADIFTGGYDRSLFQRIPQHTRIQVVGVLFDHDTFQQVTGRHSKEIHDLATGIPAPKAVQMPGIMRKTVRQLAVRDIGEADEALFLEAKVLELVSHHLGRLRQISHEPGNVESPRDKSFAERIHYAAEILERRMADPPGVFDLADAAGLNHNQLTRGFRETFSRTPYQYLRTIRLATARDLISQQGLTVTEAAFQVGYTNLSNFAKLFKKHFNINPSECRPSR